jgi:glycosyltransferase involved in cell wall biosynthesis
MKAKNKDISVVIPTRNRLDSLNRTLDSITKQSFLPSAIIIVDSSDCLLEKSQLTNDLSFCDLQIFHSKPSVCLQRNIGIEKSNSEYIFLCDDDVEFDPNYIEEILSFLEKNKTETVASGLLLENKKNKWTYCEEKKSSLSLIYSYFFGFSLGFNLNTTDYSTHFLAKPISNLYQKKGNRIAKSGWPIIINFEGKVFKTPIYGLGASIVKTSNLKKVLFDTAFYENGIGDNYDLAIGLSSEINVLTTTKAYHHREKKNRINANKSYYYRVGALHYILKKHKRFNSIHLIFLVWSLVGNSFLFLVKGKLKLLFYNFELIARIVLNLPLYKSKN